MMSERALRNGRLAAATLRGIAHDKLGPEGRPLSTVEELVNHFGETELARDDVANFCSGVIVGLAHAYECDAVTIVQLLGIETNIHCREDGEPAHVDYDLDVRGRVRRGGYKH